MVRRADSDRRKIVVTGSEGFIGRNLILRLAELRRFEALPLARASSDEDWRSRLQAADAVVHLAGINRPRRDEQFAENPALAERLVRMLGDDGRAVPIIVGSSAKAEEHTPYGMSKKAVEAILRRYSRRTGAPVAISRLPNVFGKWCRPHYNSVVATFCHSIARDLPISYSDPAAPLRLLYIDDLLDSWIGLLDNGFATGFHAAGPVYRATVGEIASAIRRFREDRAGNLVGEVGTGLPRALYATYLSYLPTEEFAYPIESHSDDRGTFSEMLRTRSSGQFSYFNALPGVTRGGHYHHTKTEKFLIVHGRALFRFRHMATGETHELRTSHDRPVVVQSIPGWAHDVTNIGDDIMVALLWASENFDRDRPDTIPAKVD